MTAHCPECPFMDRYRVCDVTGLAGGRIRECPHEKLHRMILKMKAALEGAASAHPKEESNER